jgi:hypothetical protein
MRREENHLTRKVRNMNVEGWRGRGRPKKRWIDCVRQDMGEMAVSDEMTSDRGEWRKKTWWDDPNWEKSRKKKKIYSRKHL